ncbi:MAG: hypothetical protein CM15mP103_06920 [Gammaproteobacteria bacterium]|nr:MAG: hypothetical protein CM15mP103_06920 [Gammaproteobacteria bacterium]
MRPQKPCADTFTTPAVSPAAKGGARVETLHDHRARRRPPHPAAHCEIDDEPNVLRDVTSPKKDWDTLDAFVRLSSVMRNRAAAGFILDPAPTAKAGPMSGARFSEHEAYDERPAIFGTHPFGGRLAPAVIDRGRAPRFTPLIVF